MPIEIRPMILDDYDAAYALWDRTDGVGLGPSDTREAVAAYLERNPGLSTVVMQEGQLVGAVLCGHDGRRGYLVHLALEPELRGRGYARRMVQSCLDKLKEQNIPRCHIFVFRENQNGREFWQHIGWYPRDDLGIMSLDMDERLNA